jgi:hypothetical protein
MRMFPGSSYLICHWLLGQVLQRIGTNHASHTQKKPTCECLEQMVKEPLYKFVRMKEGNQNVEYCCRHSGHEGER